MPLFRFAAGAFLLSLAAPGQTPPSPPAAKRAEHREVRHGSTVIDPYFWIREKSNPDVIQYLEAENAYTEAMTSQI